ncbi:crotonobetainyl-CoA:carnitine CoA-transferase CaiB-like acyl-CoA transferase [Antricoccus suffuscus]|uniref:Crotonobetainyl-CoA:carnitine CoA-transferase CaiB-like acyl-CoA transferase n=1 Tax=Antricoccus suffuscus TaxID=1629062 RepID=A0A2T0ZY15_9ACTN|nr:CoA transferase [Antricoccus suffuscus]PRZ41252.1 crotonobetainyl-CoA:carnitine CoA-transferase CaiB-like acyl-CoA transferase [Antricoccus suffuscus]
MSEIVETSAAPLAGLQLVSVVDEILPALSKSFADLGADVDVLRQAGENPSRGPIRDFLEGRGKRYTTVADGQAAHRELANRLQDADVLVVTPQAARAYGYADVRAISSAYPQLVIAVLTDFGLTGERKDWVGSEAVYKALSGSLSRSGEPGRRPLLQPGDIFTGCAAQEIVWSVLSAVYRSMSHSGRPGAVLECSIFEAGLVCLDPGYGMVGSGTPDILDAYDRPAAAHLYPIYKVSDGYVRVCHLTKSQWQAQLDWMGNPPELERDDLLSVPDRQEHWSEISHLIEAFYLPMTKHDLVRECRERRIPASAVLTVGDVLVEEHYRETGAVTDLGQLDGRPVTAAEGMARINGRRTRPSTDPDRAAAQPWPAASAEAGPYPLSGLTVLDLGAIVAGPVAGEVFAEQGARVIRVENTQFPDGMRRGDFSTIRPTMARGHRGKESIGLDLRSDRGRELFYELAKRADVVISNFKPGTVARLGVSYDDLVKVNPRIVCVESCAFGDTGPWSTAMGYGPLVRSGTGQTWLWREDVNSSYFADGITIFPDHLAGRVCSIAALACVVDRLRSGRGGHATVAQSDVALVQLSDLLATESVAPGSVLPPGDASPHLLSEVVLPAHGDDQWCIVDPQTPEQLAALQRVVGATSDADLDAQVAAYVRERRPDDVARELQVAGVPAGRMLRVGELLDDSALQSRQMYDTTKMTGTEEVLPVERFPVLSDDLELPTLFPMPMFGAHTRPVLAELGYSAEEIEQLVAGGIAQEWSESRSTTPAGAAIPASALAD